jgi:hypothetical protein
MGNIDFIVKTGTGKNTNLDKAYFKLINEVLVKSDEAVEERWETYNLIIKEFFTIDGGKYFEEIKYRFTDGEDPNHVILDVASRYSQDELTFLVAFLLRRVDEYVEEDLLKRFLD